MPSYSSQTHGLRAYLREALALYQIRARTASITVNQLTEEAEAFERIIVRLRAAPLDGRSILEVGPGHFFVQAYYFARHNDVTDRKSVV